MYDILRCCLVALLLTLFGCSPKPAVQLPPTPAPEVPGWVEECSTLPNEWYCGSGANDSSARENMIGQIDRTLMQMAEIYVHSNDTVYAAIKKTDVANHYSDKIKRFFDYANTELEQGRVNSIKDTLENDLDSWALILQASGGSGLDTIDIKKKDYLLMIDNLNKANAAKELADRLRPKVSYLEGSANAVISAKHPKLKSEAWQKTQAAWSEFMPLLYKVKSLSKERAAPFEPVSALYAKAKEDYLNYCKTAKLHWNPEQSDIYSSIAFSKLSKKLKLEKAKCNGYGISLIYKNTGHECKYDKCSHKPSLLIASCNGEEYRLLEENVEVPMNNREMIALKKLPGELESKSFWNGWEQEIKQLSPICE
jgi:hypothetical protein